MSNNTRGAAPKVHAANGKRFLARCDDFAELPPDEVGWSWAVFKYEVHDALTGEVHRHERRWNMHGPVMEDSEVVALRDEGKAHWERYHENRHRQTARRGVVVEPPIQRP